MELLIVSVASLLAGFVDSIVGGGGLILVPALFAVFPNTHPATLFGVNKGASIWGTAVATAQYSRRVNLRWAALFGAIPLALGTGDGAELRQPLGIAIVGGLVLSQLLTLYTTPVVFVCMDRLSRRRQKRSLVLHALPSAA